MGPSVQNSSGVHWCRRRVRFNDVPEKVAKGPEKVWEALVQSQGDPEKVPGSLGAKPGSTGFRRTFQSGSGEGRGGFGGEPCHVQQGSGEGLGGFGAEPSQMQQGSGEGFRRRFREALVQSQVVKVQHGSAEGSGEGSRTFWRTDRQVRFNRGPEKVPEKVRFNRVPEKVPEKVWEPSVQSQVKVNRVPEKVPEKVLGSLGAKPSQVLEKVPEKDWETQSQVRFNRIGVKVPEKVWEALVQS